MELQRKKKKFEVNKIVRYTSNKIKYDKIKSENEFIEYFKERYL